ncbi:MAG: hypothetical protein WC728_06630 [Elusimicrobiota bacterium]
MDPKKDEKRLGAAPVPPIRIKGKADPLSGDPMFRTPGFVNKNGFSSRFKGLKSRDLAFIVAGLAVLIMAPVAEFVLSSSDDGSGTLRQGFDQKGDFFTGAGSPYEEGIGGMAPGGLPGHAGDVITPLNVRDPISLIMGPGGDEKPMEAPRDAVKSPEKKKDVSWKDAVIAAKTGVSKAAKKVRLPKPSAKLASKLNWLSSLSGGSHGSGISLAAPSSQGLLSSPRAGSNLSHVQPAPGYRGADRRGIATGGSGAGSLFDGRRTGPAGGPSGFSLDNLPSGTGTSATGMGFGSPGSDSPSKAGGNNAQEGSKNVSPKEKEDLAFLARKMNMEKAIDLKWAKKRYDELERKKMIEQTLLQTAQQAFLKILDKLLEGAKAGGKDSGGSPGGPGGSPGPSGPGGPTGPGQGPEGSKPETIQRPPKQAFEVGGSGRGQPKDAESERAFAAALLDGGFKGMEKGSRTAAPEWKADPYVKAAAAAEPEVDGIKPYKIEQIQAALGEASQVKLPPDRPIEDKLAKVTAGVNFGDSKEGKKSQDETEKLAAEAIAAFKKANKSTQDYAKDVKRFADELGKGLPKVSEHDKRLEDNKKPLKQAKPELEGAIKTKLTQLNGAWAAAGSDDAKDKVVAEAQAAIEAYMGKVRPVSFAVNQTHMGVGAASDEAKKQIAAIRQTTNARYEAVRGDYAKFQVALGALVSAVGKIDPQGGQPSAKPDDNLKTLKTQSTELARTLAQHYKSLAGEIPTIIGADAKLNDAGDALEKIYQK